MPTPTIIKTLATQREKPFISVVTPTWNRSAFLPYLLYMYRYQDYPADRRELIILDDSPQSHQHIIDRLTNGTPEAFNIRYIHHPEKLPLGKKRNMLNELARGEYILCMDDDDYYPADKISWTIAKMQKHRALISGSDQIPIWYSHINRIFQSRSFGPHNILNGTFCYHRNYLKKHRYDDDCNLGEEKSFTDNFSVNPLQLPGERTILCISHSHNTFDKDFILGASTPVNAALTDIVSDPLLRNAYLSLHNATHHQGINHQTIDQVVVVNLDKRPDRLQQIREELALLHIPPEKITRLAASEDQNGQRGRRQSHLQALRLAQQHDWQNYLLLEDDAVILKQEKHIQVLNTLLASLAKIPWQVMILGGEISQGTMLKSLPGLVHARDCRKVCAYLVNRRYYPQLAQQMSNDEHSLEDGWQPLLRADKWLACYPSLSYQRPGFSDIEKKMTDNIAHYFNKLPAITKPSALPIADTIGFFMETSFHYALYRPIITALQAQGQGCTLVINDRVFKPFLDEMLETLKSIDDPQLKGMRLSEMQAHGQRVKCLVSPYHTPALNGLAAVNVRAMYGLAKETWNHADWNRFYQRILCYSHYSQRALAHFGNAKAVGNPRFDAWHNGTFDRILPENIQPDSRKPTVLYAPTFGALSSLPHWAEKLGRLSGNVNLICKLHHGTCSRPEEAASLALARRHLKQRTDSVHHTLALLAKADYVLTDNSGFIFDAIHVDKRVILLDFPEMAALLDGEKSYSTPESADQQIREILPVAHDVAELRYLLSEAFDWGALLARLKEIRHHYCDAFMDGKAGERAAMVIVEALAGKESSGICR
ncbi:glycosyltransferase [Escherichia coli]|uniref:glycosyltransferase n=1 Tax=Escherichia coli TaxID=562 RepID=UPI000F0AB2E9|nr:glycosyltransferase [Escherichia coli]EFG4927662.1 glycosyltransferase [Escherichia coli]EFU0751063.1 glycosyltransferase [Escherichia coli]EIY7184298.1 glycosyltransferase [Escherichia coli]EJP8586587.1 glycosyltransferase [Escherichia coli]MBB9845858.1 glycosyltransferase [Escherichia coli]